MDDFCLWKDTVHQVNRLNISHCNFKANGILRSMAITAYFSLDAYMGFPVYQPSYVSQLPLIHICSIV